MMYSVQDFENLEQLTNEELQDEILMAKDNLSELQQYFKQLEEEATNVWELPDMTILFSNINNIEAYIRKAENLMKLYDSNRLVLKAYNRRQINLQTKKTTYKKFTNLNIKTNLR